MGDIFGNIFGDEKEKEQGGSIDISSSQTSRTQDGGMFGDIFSEDKSQKQKQVEQSTQSLTSSNETTEKKGFFAKAIDAGKNVAKFGLDVFNDLKQRNMDATLQIANFQKTAPLKIALKNAKSDEERQKIQNDPKYAKYQPYASYDELTKDAPIIKFFNSDTGKKVVSGISEATSNLPLKIAAKEVSKVKVAKDFVTGQIPLKDFVKIKSIADKTYDEAYSAFLSERNDPTNKTWQKFLYEVQDTGVQSGIGIALSFSTAALTKNAGAATAVSSAYYTALSADEQIQSQGEVTSVGNIAIDVLGDQVINSVLGGILAKGGTSRIRAALEGFGIEGSTEVVQSFAKYANDYGSAKTQAEKDKVLAEANDYVKSGAMAMEFFVGGTVGGIAGGVVGGGANTSTQLDEKEVEQQARTFEKGGVSVENVSIDDAITELVKLEQTGDLNDPIVFSEVSRLRDVVNDYTALFDDKTIYVPSDVASAPLIEVVTSVLPSGKVVVKFSANTEKNGFASTYDLSQQFTSKEEATKSAVDAIKAWAQSQESVDVEENAQLEKILDFADNPRSPIPKQEAPATETANDFITKRGLNPDDLMVLDENKRIVENSSFNEAYLTELPLSAFGNPKFETLNQDTYEAGQKIVTPIEATIKDGKLVITDGANRFTQAVANNDTTIPVIVEVLNKDDVAITGDDLIKAVEKISRQPIKKATTKASKKGSTEPQKDRQPTNPLATSPDQTFYHGTLATFDKFDLSKAGENTEWDNAKWGFFFIDDKARAEKFIEDTRDTGDDRPAKVMEVQLDIKNPIDLTIAGIVSKPEQAKTIMEILGSEDGAEMTPQEAVEYLDENIDLGSVGDLYEALYDNVENKKLLQDAGYDGIVSEFGRDDGKTVLEYVAFNPEQIKIKGKEDPKPKKPAAKKAVAKSTATSKSVHAPIKSLGGEKVTTPTYKSIYKGSRIFKDTYNGKTFTTDTFVLEFKDIDINAEKKDIGQDILKKLIGGAEQNKNVLKQPVSYIKTIADTDLVFETPDSKIIMSSKYYNYFSKQYKNMKLVAGNQMSAVAVYDGNKLVGLIMPKMDEMIDKAIPIEDEPKKDFKPSGYASAIFSVDQLNQGGQPEKEKASVPITLGQLDSINPIEMPELVDIARELMGQAPQVAKMRGGKSGGLKLGDFSPTAGGRIRLQDFLFKQENLAQASKTLAHEIGHLIDYLPDQNIKRGNLLGRIASLRGFMQQTFSFNEGKGLDAKTREDIRKEIRNEVAENLGKKQKDFTLADKRTVTNLYKKRLAEVIKSGGYIRDAKIRKELLIVSRWWKPYNPKTVPPQFKAYRESAVELYADAISVLFNAPKRLQDFAPTFYNAFFEGLDAKADVRDAYFEVQSLLSGDRENLLKRRREGVKKMFKEGDYKAIDLHNRRVAEKENRRKQYWAHLKHTVIDKNFQIIDRVAKAKREGKKINDDENPVYFLEERNYIGGKIKAIFEREFNTLYSNLNENEISWDDFGETLFYARIAAGDRSDVANPRGITPDAAKELLNEVAKGYSDGQKQILTESVVKFQTAVQKINEEAFAAGLYSAELYQQMKENPAYVTFQVLDHLEEGMTSRVYKSVGTLKDITNPADATMLKIISTIRAAERNKTTKATVDFLKESFPDEIMEAKYSRSKKGRFPMPSKKPEQELITYFEEGKIKGYYVDPYIADTINNQSVGSNAPIVPIIRFMNSTLFRPLFISFNLGFQSFNLIRDFVRFYKNIPDMTFLRAMKQYGKAGRISRIRAFGLPKNPSQKDVEAFEYLNKLEQEKVLSVTFNDMISGRTEVDKQVEKILADTGIKEFQVKPKLEQVPKFAKPAVKLLDKAGILDVASNMLGFIENLGNLIETLPKAAGVFELSQDGELSTEDKSFIRRKIGSPDFLAGGTYKPITNEVFLFSNAIIQGIRSDIEIATDPKTRSGFWWKTAKVAFLPKILMMAVLYGAFGDEYKELMEGASEYDRTSYTIIPLGRDTTGKPIYFRMPVDETSRFLGGVFWKALTVVSNEKPIGSDIMDVLSYTGGQLPSISPAITTIGATVQFLSGQNPYDAFRGRLVLSDTVAKAGGTEAAKAFMGWMFQQLGGGIFYKFYHEPSAKRDTGTVEKFFNAPVIGNVLGRFVRVSDYGQVEKLKAVEAKVEKKKAQQTLDERKIINKYIDDAREQGLSKPSSKLENDLIREVFGGAPATKDDVAKAKRLIKKFELSLARGNADPNVTALVDASSNEVKLEILKKLQTSMEPQEFTDLRNDLLQNGIVSGDVFNDLLRSK